MSIQINSIQKLYLKIFLWTEQNRAEQNRTEQNRTEQNRTEQSRTEQFMASERVTSVKIQRRKKETWMEQGMLYNGIAMTILIAPPWSSMNTFPYYSERCRCITHLYCFRYAVSVSEKRYMNGESASVPVSIRID